MKYLSLFLLFAGVAALSDLDQWRQFKIKYGKTYTSSLEDRKRFNIFHENVRKILGHNKKFDKGEVTYAMKVTKFTDLTQDEFKDFLRKSYGGEARAVEGLSSDADNTIADTPKSVFEDIPEAIDWRSKGAVTKVKDQGFCGSCWAFSAVGALEGQHYKSNGSLLDLSVQDLVDCAGGSYGNMGCSGGLMNYAYDYVKDKGVVTEKEYPYKGVDDTCKQKTNGFKIKSYVNITIQDEKALAHAVATVGPISCAMDASYLSSYSHGIIDSSCGCGSERFSLNHGVLVVGYGKENGIEYWLVKNSWVLCLLVAGVAALSDLDQWRQFKINHGKAYTSFLEDRKRFYIFQENLKKISEHNIRFDKGEVAYAMKITKFTDMTQDEFKDFLSKSYGGALRATEYFSSSDRDNTGDELSETVFENIPKEVDWRYKGAVTPVKDQGMCGSCWAFSAVGALEGQHYKSNGSLLDLSVQDLVDCAGGSYGNMGCSGGLMNYAYDYVKDRGVLTDKEYPYKGIDDTCKQKTNGFKIKSYVNITIQDEKALAHAVATIGPISCAMDASYLSSYSHGIIDSSCGCGSDRFFLNHGVLVVGYGEEKGIEYWLVKNSWGTGWGDQGYFKLKKNDKNTFKAALLYSSFIESSLLYILSYPIKYGKTYTSSLEDRKRFNIFQENLKKILEHNKRFDKGEVTYAMKVTKFIDLTQDEFKDFLTRSYGGGAKATEYFSSSDGGITGDESSKAVFENVPKEVDWRCKGAVTAVKDQGMCGSCWAFSAVGAIEGQHYKSNGSLLDLSVQNLVDCAGGSYGNMGCSGGLMNYAYDYVKDRGVLTDKEYPYEGIDDTCRQKTSGFKIKSYVNITIKDEKALAHAIKYGKTYTSSLEDRKRFNIFQENLKKILEHNKRFNKGEVTYAMKVTKFIDLTQDEFKDFLTRSYGGGAKATEYFSSSDGGITGDESSKAVFENVPKEVDWRCKGAVTAVKDQGMCGSCWAFSAVGALEGQHYKSNGCLLDLSVQNLVDCAGGSYGNMGCSGGLMNYAYDYVKDRGVLTDKEYPYEGIDDTCRQKTSGFKIKSYVNITIKDEKALAHAVATVGPISCAMDASYLSSYSHGIIDSSCGCRSDRFFLNHGVLVVGYGEEKGIEYWLVKNSWGTGWGDQGYFKLKKNDKNTCGIATESSYPIV
nr:unnamed protein product [Callosobruchus analis]